MYLAVLAVSSLKLSYLHCPIPVEYWGQMLSQTESHGDQSVFGDGCGRSRDRRNDGQQTLT